MIAQHLSLTNEHYTPSHVVEAARMTMGGISLDPASCFEANQRIKAATYFTVSDDGLSRQWQGSVFLNPPGGRCAPEYSQRFRTKSYATAWWRKLWEEYNEKRVTQAIFVGFTLEILRTSQGERQWPSAMKFPICIPRERLKFGGDQPTHANVIVAVGCDFEAFINNFSPIGEVRL